MPSSDLEENALLMTGTEIWGGMGVGWGLMLHSFQVCMYIVYGSLTGRINKKVPSSHHTYIPIYSIHTSPPILSVLFPTRYFLFFFSAWLLSLALYPCLRQFQSTNAHSAPPATPHPHLPVLTSTLSFLLQPLPILFLHHHHPWF